MDDNTKASNTAGEPASANTAMSRSACLSKYMWGDGCYGWNFVDTDALSIKQELMPPGTAEELHYHKLANQFFFILTGKTTFTVDGSEIALMANEGLEIKAGQVHSIRNSGNHDLEFILYSSPSTKNDRHLAPPGAQ